MLFVNTCQLKTAKISLGFTRLSVGANCVRPFVLIFYGLAGDRSSSLPHTGYKTLKLISVGERSKLKEIRQASIFL